MLAVDAVTHVPCDIATLDFALLNHRGQPLRTRGNDVYMWVEVWCDDA
jgi:hypothetical protein